MVPVPWQVLALEHRPNDTQHELVFEASVDKIANFLIRVLPSPKNIAEDQVQFPVERSQDELTVETSVRIYLDLIIY